MVFDRYSVAAPNPVELTISTTDVSAICLGHATANSGPSVGPDAQPAKMHHLCKNVQKVVQNTAIHLLMILGISGPALSDTAPVPEGHLSHIHFSYHKVIPVPVIYSAVMLEAAFSHPAQVSSFITT